MRLHKSENSSVALQVTSSRPAAGVEMLIRMEQCRISLKRGQIPTLLLREQQRKKII